MPFCFIYQLKSISIYFLNSRVDICKFYCSRTNDCLAHNQKTKTIKLIHVSVTVRKVIPVLIDFEIKMTLKEQSFGMAQ